ncbi:hypothetical protein NM208_g2050 [Fusarium decemcellulare]|uniref:Uncharacterized protein n=1 Tax=Fusarium decemcellulare TaxID=57161 RepID=A0ACC1STR1_9HYPO|nr:hypothetical protein NM208_g2050 [Fusarium decemcellulare]
MGVFFSILRTVHARPPIGDMYALQSIQLIHTVVGIRQLVVKGREFLWAAPMLTHFLIAVLVDYAITRNVVGISTTLAWIIIGPLIFAVSVAFYASYLFAVTSWRNGSSGSYKQDDGERGSINNGNYTESVMTIYPEEELCDYARSISHKS